MEQDQFWFANLILNHSDCFDCKYFPAGAKHDPVWQHWWACGMFSRLGREDGEGYLSCTAFSNLLLLIADPAGTSVVAYYPNECCPGHDGYLIKFSVASSITLRLLVLVLVLVLVDPALLIEAVSDQVSGWHQCPRILNATTSRPRDYLVDRGVCRGGCLKQLFRCVTVDADQFSYHQCSPTSILSRRIDILFEGCRFYLFNVY